MEQQNQKYNKANIFYAVIGVATLMIAVVGATFAYFTATASNNNTIKGNMATIQFDVTVAKVTDVDESKGGMIPMSNNMMEQALQSSAGICVDNNGNAVCQVYKITVENSSTAGMFLDGYVTLSGGSGLPEDIGPNTNAKQLYTADQLSGKTTMRWAQAFCNAETNNKVTGTCTTGGNSTVRASSTIAMTALGGTSTQSNGFNPTEILTTRTEVTGTASINGNDYEVIDTNYIRISTPHTTASTAYKRADDTTSALVYSQYLTPNDDSDTNNTGTSSSTYTDAQVYYIVVWLSENGHNQTTNATNASTTSTGFFTGNVTFVSAQGSEVTATFSGHTRVTPNT